MLADELKSLIRMQSIELAKMAEENGEDAAIVFLSAAASYVVGVALAAQHKGATKADIALGLKTWMEEVEKELGS